MLVDSCSKSISKWPYKYMLSTLSLNLSVENWSETWDWK